MYVCGQTEAVRSPISSMHTPTQVSGQALPNLLCSLGLGSLPPADWDVGSVFGLVCVWCCAVLFAVSHSLVYSGKVSRLCR